MKVTLEFEDHPDGGLIFRVICDPPIAPERTEPTDAEIAAATAIQAVNAISHEKPKGTSN